MQPVVVVGGGIIGLCTAFALHQRGVAVTVLDAGPTERAASHVNAGWIVPTLAEPVPSPGLIATSLRWMLRSDSPLYIRPRLDPAFLRWTLRFWRHCNARDFLAGTEAIAAFGARSLALYDAMREAGVRYEEHRDGLLFAYRTTEALDHDYAALEPVRRFGFEISPIMSGDELRALEPSLSETVSGGYWLPQERSVRPDTLVRGLIDYLQERGVEVRRDTPVSGIETDGGKATAVFAGGERIPAETVVVAAGAWTPRLLKPLRVRVPIEAGKGYSIDLAPAPAPTRAGAETALPARDARRHHPAGRHDPSRRDDGVLRAESRRASGAGGGHRPLGGMGDPRLAGADAGVRTGCAHLERPAADDPGRPPGHRPAAGVPQPDRGQRPRHARGDARSRHRRGCRRADHHRPRAGRDRPIRSRSLRSWVMGDGW